MKRKKLQLCEMLSFPEEESVWFTYLGILDDSCYLHFLDTKSNRHQLSCRNRNVWGQGKIRIDLWHLAIVQIGVKGKPPCVACLTALNAKTRRGHAIAMEGKLDYLCSKTRGMSLNYRLSQLSTHSNRHTSGNVLQAMCGNFATGMLGGVVLEAV